MPARPALARDAAATVAKAAAALSKLNTRFALFGAAALRLRGVRRETEDVDFLLRADQRREALRRLRAAGFRVVGRPDASQATLRDRETGVRVDLLFAAGEPYDTVREEAERLEVAPGVAAPVARADGLLLAYLLSDQPRHEDDGIRLIRRKRVDLRGVQNWLWEEGDRGSLLRLRGWIARARKPESGLFTRG